MPRSGQVQKTRFWMIVNSMSGADFDKVLAGGRDLPLWPMKSPQPCPH
jgi:hypothetical protein